MNTAAFALFALIPTLIGPLPAPEKTISAKICSGTRTRAIDIPVGPGKPQLPEPCEAKGCHAGSCRKRFDLAQ